MAKTIPLKIDDQILLFLDKYNLMKDFFDKDGSENMH